VYCSNVIAHREASARRCRLSSLSTGILGHRQHVDSSSLAVKQQQFCGVSQCPTKDSSSSLRPTSPASQNAVRRPRHLAQHLGIVHLFRRHLRIKVCNDQWVQNALMAPSRRGVLSGAGRHGGS